MHLKIFDKVISELPDMYDELIQTIREQYEVTYDFQEAVKTAVSIYLEDYTFAYLNERYYSDEKLVSTLIFIINLNYNQKLEQDLSDIYETEY